MDIIVTVPKKISWESYKKQLEEVVDRDKFISTKIQSIPKDVNPDDKCYVCHNGFIIGYMYIYRFSIKASNNTKTGLTVKEYYVERTGNFHYIKEKITCKSFNGYKYLTKELTLKQ